MDAAFKLLKEVENSRSKPIDGNTCRAVIAENIRMREALGDSNSLFAAILLEKRPDEEIEKQITENNAALTTSQRAEK